MKYIKVFLLIIFLFLSSIFSVCGVIINNSHQTASVENCSCCSGSNQEQNINLNLNNSKSENINLCLINCLVTNPSSPVSNGIYLRNENLLFPDNISPVVFTDHDKIESYRIKINNAFYFNSLFPQIPRLNC
jgi:hypothetical protein